MKRDIFIVCVIPDVSRASIGCDHTLSSCDGLRKLLPRIRRSPDVRNDCRCSTRMRSARHESGLCPERVEARSACGLQCNDVDCVLVLLRRAATSPGLYESVGGICRKVLVPFLDGMFAGITLRQTMCAAISHDRQLDKHPRGASLCQGMRRARGAVLHKCGIASDLLTSPSPAFTGEGIVVFAGQITLRSPARDVRQSKVHPPATGEAFVPDVRRFHARDPERVPG